MNLLRGVADQLITAAERCRHLVDVVDAPSTAFQQAEDERSLAGGGVVERRDPVPAVRVERAQHADASVTVVAVEAHRLVVVRTTLDLLLHLGVEYRVTARYLPCDDTS